MWAPHRSATDGSSRPEVGSLLLFAVSAVWFVLQTAIEFRDLLGGHQDGWVELAASVLVFGFPPLIMHVSYTEAAAGRRGAPAWARRALTAMYVAAPLVGAVLVGWMVGRLSPPPLPGLWIGLGISGLFAAAGGYSVGLMNRGTGCSEGLEHRRFRRVMNGLYVAQAIVFIVLAFFRDQQLLVALLYRLVRAAPLVFLGVTTYFENKFEFYDLVVKRAATLMVTVCCSGCSTR